MSASIDKALDVWSLAPGWCPQALRDHSRPVDAFAVLEEGHTVSASDDKTLRVWRVTDRQRHMAVLQINRHWRDAISNPERKLCRKFLARQCED